MKGVLIFLVSTLFVVLTASAQENTSDRQESPQALPDIAPREVEIRGRLDPSLPSIQRQPITGFDVPEVMYRVPEERMPHTGVYDKPELTHTLMGRPDLPNVATLADAPPINGAFEAAAGMYLSRIVRGDASWRLSPDALVSADLRYEGSDGFKPEGIFTDATSAYNDIIGSAAIESSFGRVALGGDIRGFASQYALYGSLLSGGGSAFPERNISGGTGSLWLRSFGDARIDFQTRLGFQTGRMETLMNSGPNSIRTEQHITSNSHIQAPLPGGDLLADVSISSGKLTGGASDAGITQYSAGGAYRFLHRRRFSVTLGATVLGYDAEDADQQQSGNASGPFFFPILGLEFSPMAGMRLYARNNPHLEQHSLTALLEENPFLIPDPEVQPTVQSVNAEAGAGLFLGPLQLSGKVGFQRMPNYLFYEFASPLEGDNYLNLIAARYEEAQIGFIGADVSLIIPGGLQATVSGVMRDGLLDEASGGTSDIPYFAPLLGRGILSLPFAENRGLLQLVGTYESARRVSREESADKVGDFFDLDAALSLELTPSLGIVSRVLNISADRLERWDHFEQTPLTVMAGVQVKW